MDDLTFTEKRLLKEYFEMQNASFLNMSEEEFLQLFKELGVDMGDDKYVNSGTSQIDRFCSFLEIESRNLVIKVLKEAYRHEQLFIKRGYMKLLENKQINNLISRLSKEEIEIEEELEDGSVKESAKNTVENSIKSSMRLAKRGLKKKKEKLTPTTILNHIAVKDQRKLLENHSEDLDFYVPGSKGSEDHLEKWSREVFKED